MLDRVDRWTKAALAAARASPEAQRADLETAVMMLTSNIQRDVGRLHEHEPRSARQMMLRDILDALDAVTLALGGQAGDEKLTAELHAATQALLTSLEPFADAPTRTRNS